MHSRPIVASRVINGAVSPSHRMGGLYFLVNHLANPLESLVVTFWASTRVYVAYRSCLTLMQQAR